MNKVILSLTTIPSRLREEHDDGLKACIYSLLKQTHTDYELHFNIPEVFEHTGEPYVIPEWIEAVAEKDKRLRLFRTEDLGPVTKTIPTLERINDPEMIIVIVDDDLVYEPTLLEEQIKNQKRWPGCAVGYDGIRSRNDDGTLCSIFGDSRDHYYTSQVEPRRVDILQHYKSVSYRRKFFEDDIRTFRKENFSWADDLLIAAYLSHKGITRWVGTHPSLPKLETFDDWLQKGGVTTFPVIRHTHHHGTEGCNLYRIEEIPDNHTHLFTSFIDRGYDHLRNNS